MSCISGSFLAHKPQADVLSLQLHHFNECPWVSSYLKLYLVNIILQMNIQSPKVIFIQVLFCGMATSHSVSCPVIPDTQWAEWGIFHRAFGVPPPHSTLPLLHHPAVAFPSHPLLFLPGPSPLQPPYAPLPSSRLPSSQFRHSPEEAGAHHWRRVPGLHGELEPKHEAFMN